MSSTISQSQRIASLLLMKIPKFVGDVEAGGQRAGCQAQAKPPSWAHRVAQKCRPLQSSPWQEEGN